MLDFYALSAIVSLKLSLKEFCMTERKAHFIILLLLPLLSIAVLFLLHGLLSKHLKLSEFLAIYRILASTIGLLTVIILGPSIYLYFGNVDAARSIRDKLLKGPLGNPATLKIIILSLAFFVLSIVLAAVVLHGQPDLFDTSFETAMMDAYAGHMFQAKAGAVEIVKLSSDEGKINIQYEQQAIDVLNECILIMEEMFYNRSNNTYWNTRLAAHDARLNQNKRFPFHHHMLRAIILNSLQRQGESQDEIKIAMHMASTHLQTILAEIMQIQSNIQHSDYDHQKANQDSRSLAEQDCGLLAGFAYELLGVVQYQNQALDDAKKSFETVSELDPSRKVFALCSIADICIKKADICANKGDLPGKFANLTDARDKLTLAINGDQDNYVLYLSRAVAYTRMGSTYYNSAMIDLDKSRKIIDDAYKKDQIGQSSYDESIHIIVIHKAWYFIYQYQPRIDDAVRLLLPMNESSVAQQPVVNASEKSRYLEDAAKYLLGQQTFYGLEPMEMDFLRAAAIVEPDRKRKEKLEHGAKDIEWWQKQVSPELNPPGSSHQN
jgi:hypothetical protein